MTTRTLFTSDRRFVMVSYSASHGLLLLRSRKDLSSSKRLDLLFQDVRALEIRSWFEGIEVTEVDPADLAHFSSNPAQMIEPGNRAYRLTGKNWSGYVVGGLFQKGEDDLGPMDPSSLTGR